MGILWHRECENQAARPLDLQILANVFDIFAIASIGEVGLPANPGIDLGLYHLPCRCGKEKTSGFLRIEPGIENALGRSGKLTRDANGDSWRRTHADPLLLAFS
jgi:hypothetical protein